MHTQGTLRLQLALQFVGLDIESMMVYIHFYG